jgi:hypothetical protein
VWQGVGVQRQPVLLQRDHQRLIPGVPVRGALRPPQRRPGPRRQLLGLPGLHHRRRPLRASRVRHNRRQGDGHEGGRRLPRPCRR